MAQRTCFVISPIGEIGSATRKRADQIFNYVISEVLKEPEWKVERADRISEPGIITNQIIERLSTADLVIADLSERNPNVFYELALRHALRKPYVHLIAHDEDIPFDNAPVRAIKIDVQDLDSVNDAKVELSKQVTFAVSADNRVESPISISLSIQDLRRDGDGESAVLGAILSELGGIKRTMFEIQAEREAENIKSLNALLHFQKYNDPTPNSLKDFTKATQGIFGKRPTDTPAMALSELIARQLAEASNGVDQSGKSKPRELKKN